MAKVRMHSDRYLQKLKDRNKVRKSYVAWFMATGQTQCHYCGFQCGHAVTADHKKPLSKGGYDKRSNVVPCCRRCNGAKGDMDYDDFVAKINQEPAFRRGE